MRTSAETARELDLEIARIKNHVASSSAQNADPYPATTDELADFLDETTWSIRYGSTSGAERYQLTFRKNGTLKHSGGRVSKLEFIGPKTIRLWAFDTATVSDQFNYFTSVDCNGSVYYGVLVSSQTNR